MPQRITAVLAAAFFVAACSISQVTATLTPAAPVKVVLTDAMRMDPTDVTVRLGVPVTFQITNTGKIEHEFYIGSEAEQNAHEAEMLAGPMHEHLNGVGVAPGQTRELTYTFERAGTVLAGCHVPGHYAARMVASIVVSS